MNDIMLKENIKVENLIYEIRGKQVMLDYDLAKLYQCKNGTKDINKAVNRNKEKFPDDIYFQLTKKEYLSILRFQNGTLELKQGKYSKYISYVFTEEGVAMLATVLHTKVASEISLKIIKAFVAMRKYISNNLIEQKYINELVLKDNKRIDLLEETFSKFKENNHEIFYNGQIYDAYSKIIDIVNEAQKKLIIIDAYADKSVLDIISKVKVNTILIVRKDKLLSDMDIIKYNKQYSNLKVIYNIPFMIDILS